MNSVSFKVIFGGLVTAVSAYLGGMDGVLMTLVAFITVDYITGVLVAIKKHELSSEVGFWGLVRKMFILVLVGVGNLLDIYVLNKGAIFRTMVSLYYIGNEGLSILENAISLGMVVPQKLRDVLAQLKKQNDGKGDILDEHDENPATEDKGE